MLIKLGEAVSITKEDIRNNIDDDPEINAQFIDLVNNLKSLASGGKPIAPRAKDFMYFTAIMMHAAEAALLDDKGNIRKDASGKEITATWEPVGRDSIKWVCSDPKLLPYKNSNGDIFGASELRKAHKRWVGKPLCLDHQSQSVEMVRGIIVDTFFDEKRMRVIALCALDKVMYPELAKKVSTGVSASVSMGTAVGRAICYDCHRVAKTEADFCEHMKLKTCYGEVNMDLSPIELSIVVNGADPNAKIRRVIAAADSIAKYISQREAGIKTAGMTEAKELISKIESMVGELKQSLEKDEEITEPYGQHGTLEMASSDVSTVPDNNPGGFPDRYAAEQISDVIKTLTDKVAQLTDSINNIEKISAYSSINKEASDLADNSKETTMTEKKAYFQGGGGLNEPAPKQVKYPKEDSDSIRDKEDKQMVGQPPFPEVGPVDGMHPGVESAPEGEEARKKKLLRADENEQRRIRREAAVKAAKEAIESKKAYFQGGGGLNEPTPGKPKYPKEDSDSIRDKEDKQMVGEPPFPNVGKVDGLYGDDLKEKQKLLRAKLNANFIRTSGEDRGKDRWEVKHGDTMLLTATVEELVGPTKVAAFYDSIATKQYGKKILDTIKTQGFESAVSIFKGAQVPAAAGPAANPAGTPDAGGAAPVPPMPEIPAVEPVAPEAPVDTGETGDPVAAIQASLDEVDGLIADMKSQVQTLKEEDTSDLEGKLEGGVATASVSLPAMRKTLHDALIKGAQQAISELTDHQEELQLLNHVYSTDGAVKSENMEIVTDLSREAIDDVNVTIANVHKLMSAFIKYARGTEALVKRANEETEMHKEATECKKCKECEKCMCECECEDEEDEKEDKKDKDDAMDGSCAMDADDDLEQLLKDLESQEESEEETIEELEEKAEDVESASVGQDGSLTLSKDEASKMMGAAAEEDLTVLRTKVAQKGVTFSNMLQKAHPGGGFTTDLDTKPTGDLAKVEDLPEQHKKFMEVAEAPPRVRKAAEDIHRLVTAGKIDPENDFPALIAVGLDPAAVAYWKKFWGEAKDSESSKFVTDLVKEYQNKKAEEERAQYRVKVARAYELAHEMAKRGMISETRESVSKEADRLMNFSDENFDHMKETVSRTQVQKQASIPNVGVQDSMMSSELVVPSVQTTTEELKGKFEAAFRGKKY